MGRETLKIASVYITETEITCVCVGPIILSVNLTPCFFP